MDGIGNRGKGPLYRLAILGDGGVGKTALTIQLCLNQFVETYDPTIEDSYRKKVVLDGEPTTLEVLDTAGQEEYTALRDQWIRDGEGFLLVYSIASRSSFSRVRPYFTQILRVKDGDSFGAVLVGNKSDRTSERQVAVQEGEQLAKELGIPFFEASAKLNINAETVFMACARATRDIRLLEDQRFDEQFDEFNANGSVATEPMTAPVNGFLAANSESEQLQKPKELSLASDTQLSSAGPTEPSLGAATAPAAAAAPLETYEMKQEPSKVPDSPQTPDGVPRTESAPEPKAKPAPAAPAAPPAASRQTSSDSTKGKKKKLSKIKDKCVVM